MRKISEIFVFLDKYLTHSGCYWGKFVSGNTVIFVQKIALIVLSHHHLDVQEVGRFHIDENRLGEVLARVKNSCGLDELMYLTTCNRVEFTVVSNHEYNRNFLNIFFSALLGNASEDIAIAMKSAQVFVGEDALRHSCEVAASLDSLVVGEREIITQVRNAYETCHALGLTGDNIRVLVKKTIETAKIIYTHTDIARNPVSVVSLAYRKLKALQVPLDAKFILIGAGVTNTAMARYLKKHGYENFAVFNRSLENADKLATELGGTAYELPVLENYSEGFDVIVTCTGSEGAVITEKIYRSLVGDDRRRKVVIDLAVPNDLDPAILNNWEVNLIAVNNLNDVAAENLKERGKSVAECHEIIDNAIVEFRGQFRMRQVEIAMQAVPEKVKEIRHTALNSVFAEEINGLDPHSKEVLDKVISYMEKKYISVPMKMAREIITAEAHVK
jgi:glutamyl-tRNA reductase